MWTESFTSTFTGMAVFEMTWPIYFKKKTNKKLKTLKRKCIRPAPAMYAQTAYFWHPSITEHLSFVYYFSVEYIEDWKDGNVDSINLHDIFWLPVTCPSKWKWNNWDVFILQKILVKFNKLFSFSLSLSLTTAELICFNKVLVYKTSTTDKQPITP